MPETVSRWKALARSQVPFAEAISVLKEVGIDIACQRSKNVDEFAGQDFDYVLTVCDNAKESCPVFFGKAKRFFGKAKRLHRSFNDPAAFEGPEEKRLGEFHRVRDELRSWLKSFAQSA